MEELASLYSTTSVWLVLFATPVYVLMAVFSPALMRILSEGFEAGARNVRVSVPGGVLIIDIERTSDGTVRPYLTGLTNIVAEGRVRDEELQLTIDERCVNLHRNEK